MLPWNDRIRTCLGEAAERVDAILGAADRSDCVECLEAWLAYLDRHLVVPFDALMDAGPDEVGRPQTRPVSVERVQLIDADFGVIAEVRDGGETALYPLSDLTAVDQTSANGRILADYALWRRCCRLASEPAEDVGGVNPPH